MWNKNIQTFIGCDSNYEDANIVIFGAPYDSSTSYRPGTRFASNTMRQESYGLETYSPYQDKDLEDHNYFDGGDLELSFGDSSLALKQIEQFSDQIVSDHKIPFMIGGEHLVTLGNFKAILKHHPDVHVIHFDAHTDLREDYLDVTLSHACVIRRMWELVGDGRIHQFGIRSGLRSEFQFGIAHTDLHKFTLDGLVETIASLKEKPVYITIDLDVLDPSIFPGTGTPEAGGLQFIDLLDGILQFRGLNVVGCDLNELSPLLDTSGASTAVACKVWREFLLAIS